MEMIFMRRVICFVLALVFLLSMSCTAFATVDSAGDSGRPVATPGDSNGSPKTGDVIMTWVVVLVLSLLALAVVVVLYRKFAR